MLVFKMDEEFNVDEDLEVPEEKKPGGIAAKTPKSSAAGKKANIFFMSTIGPGEKKQKLMVDTGNDVGAIKQTVGNMFGLNPADFHLSFGGVTMEEASPLNDYNVDDGDTVLLIPASTAG